MGRYLIDTHTALWWLDDPAKLAGAAFKAIQSAESELFVSTAAMWELSIKMSVGRLRFPPTLPGFLSAMGVQFLEVSLVHALAVADLPMHHRDPFDRIQIVQAQMERLTLITRDRQMQAYSVPILAA